MPDAADKSELLKELRIDRSAPPRSRWRRARLGLVVALVLAAAGLGWFALGRATAPAVQVAVARSPGQESAVLDASGYVPARRQATVSA